MAGFLLRLENRENSEMRSVREMSETSILECEFATKLCRRTMLIIFMIFYYKNDF